MSMKLNHLLFDQMRDLLGKGPAAATAAIQQALTGRPKAVPEATATVQPMRDINPAPSADAASHPRSRAAIDVDASVAEPTAARAQAAQADTQTQATPSAPVFNFGGNASDMAQDMLSRMGISPELQANMNASLQSNLKSLDLKNFELPGFDFSGLDRATQTTPAAPAELPPNAQFITGSYRNQAGTRNYKLYIPSSYHGQAMPLLVMLHGCTQDPDDFAAGTQMNAVAEEQQCFVVYPEQTRNANNSKCWNWFNAIDQQRGQGDPVPAFGVVGVPGLLRIDDEALLFLGHGVHLRAGGEIVRVLRAAVQHHQQRHGLAVVAAGDIQLVVARARLVAVAAGNELRVRRQFGRRRRRGLGGAIEAGEIETGQLEIFQV